MAWRDPSAVDGEDGPARRRWGRRVALAVGLPLAVAIVAAWIERRPIATHYIDRTLAAHGVPARYTLVALGPGRQRLTGVVIGDPARPDLVADWIETETGLGLGGIELTGVRAGRVRVRGRIVAGRLSLGSIDRLLPTSSGKAGGLPAWAVDIADARLRLDMPAGVIGVALAGRGRLDEGFAGRLTASGDALASGGCAVAAPHAVLAVTTRAGRLALAGPVSATKVACGATRWEAPRVTLDVSVDPATSAWAGRWHLAGGALFDPRGRAASVSGDGTLAIDKGQASGRLTLAVDRVRASGLSVDRAVATGGYKAGGATRFTGTVGVSGATATGMPALVRVAKSVASTPVGPLATKLAGALATAGRSMTGSATVALSRRDGAVAAIVSRAVLAGAAGASATFDGSADLAGAIDGRVLVDGGGLPRIAATLRRQTARAPLTGAMVLSPYAADGASLAMTPAAFTIGPDGAASVATTATLTGPVGDGRVEALSLPLAVRRDATGAVTVDRDCVPLTIASLTTGGLRLGATRLTLCPIDGALVRVAANGAVGGGARIGAMRLAGRLGDSPLTVVAGGATLALGTRGFTAADVAATLGAPARQTRFEAATLTGTLAGGGIAGEFGGAGGRIGAVPLLLSDAAGKWSVAGGALDVAGALTVSDADAAPPRVCGPKADPALRFCPLRARDVAVRLTGGRITAIGVLAEPTTGARVAGVAIAHDLSAGAGHADLSVASLSFTSKLQPDMLTPVTQGVIANVAGTLDGEGHIAWTDAGVTSVGRFATAGTDLAATVGPVKGIAGQIVFTDLLGLVSAPGQQVTVASINPGVPVENGTIRFHTEPGVKVAVESARWPFAGGMLTLDPTLLDFSAPAERHMTFHLDGIAADRFLQQFEFKNLSATGTFDGVLPMIFDATGGRIENGHLTVRESGGGIAYVGDLTEKDLGTWGNFAFQSLKSLRYRSLVIQLNGPLEGEMVTEVRFAGISQGAGAKSNFLVRRLQRLPIVFNIKIKAPFRELLQTTGSLSDPSDLIRRNLPALLGTTPVQAAPVQPGASAPVPETKRP